MSDYSLSRGPSPGPQGSPPLAKRKKLSTACDACQKRKSRCEMVTAKGCHRCKTLGTACSRAAARPVWTNAAGSLRKTPDDTEDGRSSSPAVEGTPGSNVLDEIQQRTRRIEGLLTGLMRHRADSGRALQPHAHPAMVPITAWMSRTPPKAQASELLVQDQSAASFANHALSISRTIGFQDPVRNGLTSLSDWSRIYQRFACSINQVVPIGPLLPTSPPDDALLRTCILYYCATHAAPSPHMQYFNQILAHVRTNLDRLALIPPSRHIVLALLVLSLAPMTPSDGGYLAVPDRFNAARRALEMARLMRLDAACERVESASNDDLEQDWMEQDIQDALLWYALLQRSRWMQIFASQRLLVPPSAHGTLLLSKIRHPLAVHLDHEARLFDLIHAVLTQYRAVRTAQQYDSADLEALILAVEVYAAQVAKWAEDAQLAGRQLSSLSGLILASHTFNIILYLQLSSHDILPSPLGPDVISRLPKAYASRILSSSVSALGFLVDLESAPPTTHHLGSRAETIAALLSGLPAFSLQLVILAYKAVIQSRKFEAERPQGIDVNLSPNSITDRKLSIDELGTIKSALLRAYPHLTGLIAQIDGEQPHREWAEPMRELQYQQGWEEWERMFDFDSFFNTGQDQQDWGFLATDLVAADQATGSS